MSHRSDAGEFCWNELATPNTKAAKEFYGQVFGWKFHEHAMGESTYIMIQKGEKDIAGMWEISKDQTHEIPPHWMSYILVDDIESSLEKAKKHGATIKVPVTKAGEFGLFSIIVDPTGAHVALWKALQK